MQGYERWRNWYIDYALDTGNKELFDKMNGDNWKYFVMQRRAQVKNCFKQAVERKGYKLNG